MIGRKRTQRKGLFTCLPEASAILKALSALEPETTLEINFSSPLNKQGFYTYLCAHFRGQYKVRNPAPASILVTKRRFKKEVNYGDRRRRDIVRILETFAAKGLIHFAGDCPNRAQLYQQPRNSSTSPEASQLPEALEANRQQLAEAVALEFPWRKSLKSEDLSPPPTEPANPGGQE